MTRVLILGAGMVAKPLIDDLAPDFELELAALDVERAEALAAGWIDVRPRLLDVRDADALAAAVAGAGAVVSLLPAPFHPRAAAACLEHRVPLVTTSYVSAEMAALDGPARQRGVLLVNECGLDPGIDHALAGEAIRRAREAGEEVEALTSFCGGLPAPEACDNPWGYKLSWSPRAVLAAARSPVRYLAAGRVIEQPTPYEPAGLTSLELPEIGRLEGYPNRDSVAYRRIYGIPEARDLLRGTLRYPGWSETFRALLKLGLLDPEPLAGDVATYAGLTARRLPPSAEPLPGRLAHFLGLPPEVAVIERLEWLGLTADEPLPPDAGSAADALAARFAAKLRYRPGERDLVVLEHRLTIRSPAGGRRRLTERLIATGSGDESAMARTVSSPAALVCRAILAGEVDLTGVQIPFQPQLAGPIAAGLAGRGLEIERAVEER